MSEAIDLLDAVVTAINAGSYSQRVTAERSASEEFDLEKYNGVRVAVIGGGSDINTATLDGNSDEQLEAEVVISAKVASVSTDDVDPLMEIVRSIRSAMATGIAGTTSYSTSFQQDEPYDFDRLRTELVFHSTLNCTFKMLEAA